MKAGQIYAKGTPQDVLTAELIKDVYGVDCHISTNPVTQQLMISYFSMTCDK
ncbi:hypothetical protein [Lysinibacillus alkalisoli]|nr:hypothetical protein [Lysinibacillus alkalisoli]